MKKLNTFFPLFLIFISLTANADSFDNMLESMVVDLKEARQQMEHVWKNFSNTIEESWASMPQFSFRSTSQQSIDINYEDTENILVTIQFPEDSLKDVQAQTNEKRNTLSVTVAQENGDINITVDRSGIRFVSELKVEHKTKAADDEKETTQVSYQSQSSYQSFQTPVEAAGASVKTKGDSLIITLPREEKIRKLTVEREK